MTTTVQAADEHTSYKDYIGWYSTGLSTAALPVGTKVSTTDGAPLLNVALVLDRANDPTAPGGLLTENWATRQQQIQTMVGDGTLWSTYGANPQEFTEVLQYLHDNGFKVLGREDDDGYITSAASRTIWVQLSGKNFNTLFGADATLMQNGTGDGATYFWEGQLKLPEHVKGLWFDEYVPQLDFEVSKQAPVDLEQGIQGPGNGSQPGTGVNPPQIADYYNYPLSDLPGTATPALGLLEPGLGASPPQTTPQQTTEQLLSTYRTQIGLDPFVAVIGVQPGGPSITAHESSSERSLDIGVATAVNPQSTLILFAGSGTTNAAKSEPYTAYFQSVWDPTYNPSVVSSSFHFNAAQPHPDSPFMFAARQLFIDAALDNVSMFSSSGDGGSSYEISNGITNVSNSRASPYVVVVGGTSLSTVAIAETDSTLTDKYVTPAMKGDRDVLWDLVAGGLTTAPVSGAETWFAEAVWNRYRVTELYDPPQTGKLDPGYQQNQSSNAGYDFTQPAPWYQSAFQPFPQPTNPNTPALQGRAVPDVVALSAGNMLYNVPSAGMTGDPVKNGGTSAATPFWASLAVQINAILVDQGFPAGTQLGYMTDLLYIAAAIAPGAFNDISIGDNVSSFDKGDSTGPYLTPISDSDTSNYTGIVPTGTGYYAGPGYDVATGLGSPNGTLLARAISDIAHAQMYYATAPDVLDSQGSGWASGVEQNLLVQVMSTADASVTITADGHPTAISSKATTAHAWTAQLAQQVLQRDFDSSLVTLFDGASQGSVSQVTLSAGESLAVSINGTDAQPYSLGLTNSFGFDDFQTTAGAVRVARPVALAEVAPSKSDPTAIVRVRQNGVDHVELVLYRVDDLTGAIGNLHPGDPGYEAAAQARAYHTSTGAASIAGPGYGKFVHVELPDIDAGDLVALELKNLTTHHTFWGFTQGNETVDGQMVPHLLNYGLNTFGFEDRFGGGDRDYNDLIVGVDFTSKSGNDLLV